MGVGLFLVVNRLDGEHPQEIVVHRESLLGYVRQQSRDFAPGHAEQRLAKADAKTRKELTAQYVREEALYREARTLRFDAQDYVIRRRLVQRVEQLAQGLATTQVELNETSLREYYAQNSLRYRIPARVTFTHVFFAQSNQALSQAQAKLVELKAKDVAFSQASQHGERFLYHLNYVERPFDFIGSHFGLNFALNFAQRLQDNMVVNHTWQGPLQSNHGYHLVLVSEHQPEHLPVYGQVQSQVMTDYRQQQIDTISRKTLSEIVAKYRVTQEF